MPIYEYQCADCGERIERLQRIDDPAPDACEACGGSMQRQLSAPAFQFKGTGWYVTDYSDRKAESTKDGDAADSREKGEKGEKGKDAKADSDTAEKKAPAQASKSPVKTADKGD